jgi:predicted secreted protein
MDIPAWKGGCPYAFLCYKDIVNSMHTESGKQKIRVIAHCLLNPAARLAGISPPARAETGDELIIQLPCPELIYLGADRREITKTQLEHAGYRRFCRDLFLPFADMIEELYKKGFDVEITGVRKSPSCAAECTTTGGPAGKVRDFMHSHVRGKGVFLEEIEKELDKRNVFFSMREL